MDIVGLCIFSNNSLLEEFGLEGRWICKGYLESNSGGLLTGLGLGGDYIWGECGARGLLALESR